MKSKIIKNKLTKLYPYGGISDQNISNEEKYDQQNQQFDSVATQVPVYGQIYGLAKTGEGIGKSFIKKDQFGNPTTDTGAIANDWLTPDHEAASKAIQEDGVVGGIRELSGIGKIGRTVSTLTGNDQKTSGFWGKANKFLFTNGGIKYANGGANAEVEKQENTIAPNGQFTQYNGPSHENGGIKTHLENGEIIFSDKLKSNGKTFADLNKKNNTNKEDKILNDNKTDHLNRLTADLMKEAKLRNSMNLFEEQESLKQSKIDKYTDRYEDIHKYGGIHIKNENRGKFNALKARTGKSTEELTHSSNPLTRKRAIFAQNAKKWHHEDGGIHQYPNGGDFDIAEPNEFGQTYTGDNSYESNYFPSNNSTSNTVPSTSGSGTNWMGIASQVLQGVAQNAGNLYDLKRSNKPEVESYDRVKANLVDPTAELNYNDQVFRSANESIKNSSVGNSSTYIQNRKDLAINQMLTNARIKSQYDNQNANILNNTSYANANIQMNEANSNAANRGVNRNIRSNAISNIGQNIMSQNKDYKQQKRDEEVLDIILKKYPEAQYDPSLMKYYKK